MTGALLHAALQHAARRAGARAACAGAAVRRSSEWSRADAAGARLAAAGGGTRTRCAAPPFAAAAAVAHGCGGTASGRGCAGRPGRLPLHHGAVGRKRQAVRHRQQHRQRHRAEPRQPRQAGGQRRRRAVLHAQRLRRRGRRVVVRHPLGAAQLQQLLHAFVRREPPPGGGAGRSQPPSARHERSALTAVSYAMKLCLCGRGAAGRGAWAPGGSCR